MYITQHKYSIERLPEATLGGGKISPSFSFLNFFLLSISVVCRADIEFAPQHEVSEGLWHRLSRLAKNMPVIADEIVLFLLL